MENGIDNLPGAREIGALARLILFRATAPQRSEMGLC